MGLAGIDRLRGLDKISGKSGFLALRPRFLTRLKCAGVRNDVSKNYFEAGSVSQFSKNHLQGQLYLPRSIRIGGCQRVARNLEMAWIEIDSQFVADLYEICRIALQAVLGDQNALVITIQEIERFDNQVQLHSIVNVQAPGQARVGGRVIRSEKRIAARSRKPVIGAVAVLIGIA